MTYTPGPWHEEQDEHDPDMLMVTTKERTEQNYAPIANIDVHFSLAFDEEQRANARLIAAAPDMLEVLQGELHEVEEDLKLANDSDLDRLIKRRNAIEVVIAKAEGRS